MNPETRILITGAGGFIGGWVAESLYLTGFRNIRAGIRRWSGGARLGRFPIEIVLCDVMDTTQVDKAIDGVDVVIHCAVGPKAVNVSGTENVLSVSLSKGIRKFVHFSTVDVYGEAEGEITEETPYEYTGREYGDSKIEAEKLCWRYFKRGLPLVMLRPTIVYGPFCKLWTVKFAERLLSRNWGILKGFADGTCNLVYIEDLLRAVNLSLKSDKAVGQVFNINGPESISWNEYFRHFNQVLGLPQLREITERRSRARSVITMPLRSTARFVLDHYRQILTLLYQRSDLVQGLSRQVESSLRSIPSMEELNQFSRRVNYDISKARSVLGYLPQVGVKTGLELSLQWLQHETLLLGNQRVVYA